jgi:hypothetical protein
MCIRTDHQRHEALHELLLVRLSKVSLEQFLGFPALEEAEGVRLVKGLGPPVFDAARVLSAELGDLDQPAMTCSRFSALNVRYPAMACIDAPPR